MKKIGILAIFLLLVGCSNDKETTTVCKSEQNNSQIEETIEAKGDEVSNYVIVITQDLSKSVDTSVYSDEELKQIYDEDYDGTYDGLKGVEYTAKVKDGILTRTLTIDYDKADIKELAKSGLIEGTNSKEIDYISLEKSIESSKKGGATCKEK